MPSIIYLRKYINDNKLNCLHSVEFALTLGLVYLAACFQGNIFNNVCSGLFNVIFIWISISYYEHNRYTRIPKLIDHLIDGKDIALITDAGTPGISDPAYRLIRAAINSDCRVESIPGASASLAALVASGLPTDRFIFEGFLPHKKGRKGKLEKIKDIDATIIFYESPNRLVRTLKDILEYIGNRPIAIGRELSKKFEEIMRGRVSDILSHYNTNKPKGEFVIVIGKDDPNVYF